MQKLIDLQIEQLYNFTKKHYVEWYDVQTELVDHLANGIEEQWHENPNISFEDALKIEFKKFGILGFSDLVEQKTKALNKFYRNQVWKYFKAFFGFPKIIATLFSIWVLYLILDVIENKMLIAVPFLLLVVTIYTVHIIREKRRINNVFKKTGKKWLIDTAYLQLSGLVHLLNLGPLCSDLFESNKSWSDLSELILSIFIVAYILLFYISIKIVEPKLKKKLSKEYPEYNFNQIV